MVPDPSKGITYTAVDYSRMRSFGANYESIRLLAGDLGDGRQSVNSAYMDELRTMVGLADKAGIYSDFKMTIYDIPHFDWTAFWNNRNGEQDQYFAAWKIVWEAFKDDSDVVAFDLLNEPSMGNLGMDQTSFQDQFLTPFYERAVAALRTIDGKHMAFIQPEAEPGHGIQAYAKPPRNLANIAYAPHFYPAHAGVSTADFQSLLDRFRQEASLAGAPLILGEYGLPWRVSNDGKASLEQRNEQTETLDYQLFGKFGLSYSRPWYSDDSEQNRGITWAIFPGTSGRAGAYRTWIVKPFMQAAGK